MLKHIVLGIVLLAGLLFGTAWEDETLNQALNDAVYAGVGDKAKVNALISKGANVNAKNGYGTTPLHLAASMGDKEIAELLISKGAAKIKMIFNERW